MKATDLHGFVRFLGALRRDNRGVSAIEFAIAAPFVFIFVLGTVELAVDMMIDATVQIAAQSASRVGLTTTNPATGTRATQAKQMVTSIMSGWTGMPKTTLTITELDYSTYNNVGSSSYTAGLGLLGDVVSYNITFTTPGISGIPQLVGIPLLTFQRNYIVQNEK
ncbi:TadE/TadG family type IV pilus assembly protein [Caballeronia sordidicola]|uniref:TadE/TadG family type IV pilus assembly protein n=1 Tax=Caballeronia sordidicola TaxID=196367 RepID=UPI0004CFF4FF|nr:TadE/TadG family type IV pilus assembly protein [Caballeronia sordidicola]